MSARIIAHGRTKPKGPSRATAVIALPVGAAALAAGAAGGGLAGLLGGTILGYIIHDIDTAIGYIIFGGLSGLGQALSGSGDVVAGLLSGLGLNIWQAVGFNTLVQALPALAGLTG